MSCGERHICRGQGDEEQVEVGGLFAIWGHDNIWAWAAAQGHVYVCGPAAGKVYVDA